MELEFFTINTDFPIEAKYLLLLIPVMILNLILIIVALISIAKDNLSKKEKIIWALVSLCITFFGPLAYLVISGIHKKGGISELHRFSSRS
jgi:hypothetical protein